MTPSQRALCLLALAALVARLAIWPWFEGIEPRIYDERDYVEIATNLATRGEFVLDGEVTSERPPLYPALLALVYRVAGVGNHQAARLVQILLNVALVPLVYALGRRLYDERTGLWAAGLAVFYPSLWGHDYLLLTEVLFTLLLTAGTLALVLFVPGATRWSLMSAAALLLGLATLTRTPVLLYPPLLAVALFGWWRAPSRRRIAAVALFCAVFALTLLPWMVRNTRLDGRPSIDSGSGLTAAEHSSLRPLVGERAAVRFSPRQVGGGGQPIERAARPASERRPGTSTRSPAITQARGSARDVGSLARIGKALSSVAWDAVWFWRIDRELAGAAARGWLGPLPRPVVLVLAAAISVYYMALMFSGVLGCVLRPPADRLHLVIVLSVVAVVFGVHALTVGHSRYHVPLMPLVSVFAARLVVARGAAVTRRRLAAGALAVALLAGGWLAAFVREDLSDLRSKLGGATSESKRRAE